MNWLSFRKSSSHTVQASVSVPLLESDKSNNQVNQSNAPQSRRRWTWWPPSDTPKNTIALDSIRVESPKVEYPPLAITPDSFLFLDILRQLRMEYNGSDKLKDSDKLKLENLIQNLKVDELNELCDEIREKSLIIMDGKKSQREAIVEIIRQGKRVITRYVSHIYVRGTSFSLDPSSEEAEQIKQEPTRTKETLSFEGLDRFFVSVLTDKVSTEEKEEEEPHFYKPDEKEKEKDYPKCQEQEKGKDRVITTPAEEEKAAKNSGAIHIQHKPIENNPIEESLTAYLPTCIDLLHLDEPETATARKLKFYQRCVQRIVDLRSNNFFRFPASREQLDIIINELTKHESYFAQIYSNKEHLKNFKIRLATGPDEVISEIYNILDDIKATTSHEPNNLDFLEEMGLPEEVAPELSLKELSLSVMPCRKDNRSLWQAAGLFLGLSSKGLIDELAAMIRKNPMSTPGSFNITPDDPEALISLFNLARYYKRPIVVLKANQTIDIFAPTTYPALHTTKPDRRHQTRSAILKADLLSILKLDGALTQESITATDTAVTSSPLPGEPITQESFIHEVNVDFNRVRDMPNPIYLIEHDNWTSFDAAVPQS